jgi:hypothetical protein
MAAHSRGTPFRKWRSRKRVYTGLSHSARSGLAPLQPRSPRGRNRRQQVCRGYAHEPGSCALRRPVSTAGDHPSAIDHSRAGGRVHAPFCFAIRWVVYGRTPPIHSQAQRASGHAATQRVETGFAGVHKGGELYARGREPSVDSGSTTRIRRCVVTSQSRTTAPRKPAAPAPECRRHRIGGAAGVHGSVSLSAFPQNEHDHRDKHDCEPHGFDRPRSFNDHRNHDHDSDDAEYDHPKLTSHGHSVWVRVASQTTAATAAPQDPAIPQT